MSRDQTPKLCNTQKADLRNFKRENPKAGFSTVGRVTVLSVPIGNGLARMSTAIAAKHELKIRRKVGEYLCAQRFVYGQSILVSDTQCPYIEAGVLSDCLTTDYR